MAFGAGRQSGVATVVVPPRAIYASAVNDANTCPACRGNDGKQYATVEESLVDFPAGGYVNCDGELRCRCTRVFVWATEEPPTNQFPGDTGRPGPGQPGGPPLPGHDRPPPGPKQPTPDAGLPKATPTPPEPPPLDDVPAIKQAKTAREAQAIAQSHPVLRETPAGRERIFDYQGMDPRIANELNTTYARLLEEYPTVAERIQYIGTQAGFKRRTALRLRGNIQRSLMWAQRETGAIATLPKFHKPGVFDAITASLKRMTETGWLAGEGTLEGTIAHELGHHAFWELGTRPAALEVLAEALGSAIGAAPGEVYVSGRFIAFRSPELRKRVRAGLSQYAMTNTDELMAEAFAEYATSANPRPIAKALGQVIDRYLRRST